MNENAKLISNESSSREVFNLMDGTVLKRPKNDRGDMECYNEWSIFNNSPDWVKDNLCPVVSYDIGNGELIMKKIKAFTLKDNIKDILKEKEEMIQYLVKEFDIDEFDLTFAFNWGIDENGKVLLLDYGHTFCDDYVS